MVLVRTHTLSWWLLGFKQHHMGNPGEEVPVIESAKNSAFPIPSYPFALLTFLLQQRCLWDGAEEMKVMGMVGGHVFQSHMGLEKQC